MRVLADAKLDSVLVVWFLTLAMSKRPAHHDVQLSVLLVGVCWQAAAARLLQEVFACARAQAAAVDGRAHHTRGPWQEAHTRSTDEG